MSPLRGKEKRVEMVYTDFIVIDALLSEIYPFDWVSQAISLNWIGTQYTLTVYTIQMKCCRQLLHYPGHVEEMHA